MTHKAYQARTNMTVEILAEHDGGWVSIRWPEPVPHPHYGTTREGQVRREELEFITEDSMLICKPCGRLNNVRTKGNWWGLGFCELCGKNHVLWEVIQEMGEDDGTIWSGHHPEDCTCNGFEDFACPACNQLASEYYGDEIPF